MIKLQTLSSLTREQYDSVANLWQVTGIGNPNRGDSYESACLTLANGARIILAYLDEVAVGTAWVTHDFRRMYIHHMAVHPDYQNRGIGHKIMEAALAVAKDLNLQIKLEVHGENHAARKLYQDFGFFTMDGYVFMIKRDV